MANIKGTCNKDDINILASACMRVCVRARVRALRERETDREREASVPRKAALSVSFTQFRRCVKFMLNAAFLGTEASLSLSVCLSLS